MKLAQLAERLRGRLIGDGEIEIAAAAPIETAGERDLAFLSLNAYRELVFSSRASALLVVAPVEDCPCAQIVCADPYLAFAQAMRMLYPPKKQPGTISELAVRNGARLGADCTVHPFVVFGAGVSVGDRTVIYPHVFIGDGVEIGEDCIIHSHVSIREECRIGSRVILQNGCRIGSDGYGFAQDAEGRHVKIPQVGRVVIGDDVEVGANSCIDRATLAVTAVGRGTKLDNLVQVGHNVTVGEDCLLVAQVGIAGSSKIGRRVTLAGQVGISDHLAIGDGATVGGKSGVTRDVPPEEVVTGYPAMPHRLWAKLQRALVKLAEREGDET